MFSQFFNGSKWRGSHTDTLTRCASFHNASFTHSYVESRVGLQVILAVWRRTVPSQDSGHHTKAVVRMCKYFLTKADWDKLSQSPHSHFSNTDYKLEWPLTTLLQASWGTGNRWSERPTECFGETVQEWSRWLRSFRSEVIWTFRKHTGMKSFEHSENTQATNECQWTAWCTCLGLLVALCTETLTEHFKEDVQKHCITRLNLVNVTPFLSYWWDFPLERGLARHRPPFCNEPITISHKK